MRIGLIATALGLSLLMTERATSADVIVFVDGAMREAFNELAPTFARASGHKTNARFAMPSIDVSRRNNFGVQNTTTLAERHNGWTRR